MVLELKLGKREYRCISVAKDGMETHTLLSRLVSGIGEQRSQNGHARQTGA
jgi:hypothetical protein